MPFSIEISDRKIYPFEVDMVELFNLYLMMFTHHFYAYAWAVIFLLGSLFSMTPLSIDKDHQFHTVLTIWLRRLLLVSALVLVSIPFIIYLGFDVENKDKSPLWFWYLELFKRSFILSFLCSVIGLLTRFLFTRYFAPIHSAFLKGIRVNQTEDTQTDIRDEAEKIKAKDFLPSNYYKEGQIFLGLDSEEKPLYVPLSTWREVNMQVIGATRYGKGVLIGNLMEQSILNGDQVIYIDPKDDKFAPHVMYQACQKAGRKFIYLSLNDDEAGSWLPFAGGSYTDAFSRIETAFGLKLTGEAGDFYKTQETKLLEGAFRKTRDVKKLFDLLDGTDALRVIAELQKWKSINSFIEKKSRKAFDIDRAIEENAVVYIKGSLSSEVIRVATKLFIIELVQSAKRLFKNRTSHLTIYVDEVSFLASQELARAMATMLGFNVNFVLAYQSPDDIVNTDDKTIDGRAISQSINTNSQLKAIYGGKNFEVAEWIAELTGVITKQVSKLEKTEIKALGGEVWDKGRSIGTVEENLINTNMVLSLEPRVCVLIRPRELAKLCYTSFVPVEDMNIFPTFLSSLKVVESNETLEKSSHTKDSLTNDDEIEDYLLNSTVTAVEPVKSTITNEQIENKISDEEPSAENIKNEDQPKIIKKKTIQHLNEKSPSNLKSDEDMLKELDLEEEE
ncbi:type IV secretory system conjugative DNA transfer family protein [Acinetobacter baumannii]|uniref:type IV secretory system conjugative DNA transfer family protein n=2 Tax=Acinetobacter baumannii TaxID=470 RepID=UPI00396C7C3B